jgi:hypothetical protein
VPPEEIQYYELRLSYVYSIYTAATRTRDVVVKAYSVAFAFSVAARSALAFSRSTRRSSFPLGFFGMASMNSTPPFNHLYWTFTSDTYYDVGNSQKGAVEQFAIFLTLESSVLSASA